MIDRAVAAGAKAICMTIDVTSHIDPKRRPRGGMLAPEGLSYPMYGPEAVEPGQVRLGVRRSTPGSPLRAARAQGRPPSRRRPARDRCRGEGDRRLESRRPDARWRDPDGRDAARGRRGGRRAHRDPGRRRHPARESMSSGHSRSGRAPSSIGRPFLWGLAIAGEAGQRKVFTTLRAELKEDARHLRHHRHDRGAARSRAPQQARAALTVRITEIRADTLTIGPTIVRVFTDEGLVGLSELGWQDPAIFRAPPRPGHPAAADRPGPAPARAALGAADRRHLRPPLPDLDLVRRRHRHRAVGPHGQGRRAADPRPARRRRPDGDPALLERRGRVREDAREDGRGRHGRARPGLRRVQDPDGLGPDPLRRRPGQGPRDGAPGPGGARAGRLARVRRQPRLLRRDGDPAGSRVRAARARPLRGAAARARHGRPARGLPGARHPGLDRRAAQASLGLPRPHRAGRPGHPPARHRRRRRDQRGRPDLPAGRGLREAGHAPQPVGRDPVGREHAGLLDGAVGGPAARVLGRVRPGAGADRRAVRGAGPATTMASSGCRIGRDSG